MAISAALKTIIEKHIDEVDGDRFDAIVCEAILEDVLDELLDMCYKSGITIPPEVVTKQLSDYYVNKGNFTAEEKDSYNRKINYLINKHQVVIIRTMDAPKH